MVGRLGGGERDGLDWRGRREEGRRLKSLKMLFTRNSIIYATGGREGKEEEVEEGVAEGGSTECPNPDSGLFGGRPRPEITSIGVECFEG